MERCTGHLCRPILVREGALFRGRNPGNGQSARAPGELSYPARMIQFYPDL
jgi:hypothetical protein